MKAISVVIPISMQDRSVDWSQLSNLIEFLFVQSPRNCVMIALQDLKQKELIERRLHRANRVDFIEVDTWISASTMLRILAECKTDILFVSLTRTICKLEPKSIEKFVEVAEIYQAGIVYSDYRQTVGLRVIEHPTASYQEGCIRDTFDLGSLVLLSIRAATEALKRYGAPSTDLRWLGFYDLRLKLSIDHELIRIAEPLYSTGALPDKRSRSETQDITNTFYAVDKSDRQYQIEAENIATAHLHRIGAYLPSGTAPPPPCSSELEFKVTASVIIPVYNREKTLTDAIESAINQVTSFLYNIIIVDDYSTDSTAKIIRHFCSQKKNIVHIIPERKDLGIGGLWNEAIYSPECGLYALQLDSDDVFAHDHAIELMVSEFTKNRSDGGMNVRAPLYAMVLGSFTCVDEDLNEIPPGVDQRLQLSRENLRNNLLCIEGPSAPRAFYVPVLRKVGFPNVSFGEDYAIALRIAREYDVGRVFESTYLARHWRENTTRTLPYGSLKGNRIKNVFPAGINRKEFLSHIEPIAESLAILSSFQCNSYKDHVRTVEIQARKTMNQRLTMHGELPPAAPSV